MALQLTLVPLGVPLHMQLHDIITHCISSSDIDECESSPCNANAICENTEGSYECYCKSGFSGDGYNCLGMFLIP